MRRSGSQTHGHATKARGFAPSPCMGEGGEGVERGHPIKGALVKALERRMAQQQERHT